MKHIGTLTQQKEIEQHLRQVSVFKTHIKLYTKEREYIQRGHLDFQPNSSRNLIVIPPPAKISLSKILTCQYIFENSAWVFQSPWVDLNDTQISLALPDAIQQYERRELVRVQPSKKAPVYVRLSLSGKVVFKIPACDISGGGCSILIPRNHSFFSAGETWDALLELPQVAPLQLTLIVKNINSFLGVARIGFTFHEISERDKGEIVSYAARRLTDSQSKKNKTKKSRVPKVCIVETNADKTSFLFLEAHYDLAVVSHLEAVGQLKKHPPDMILLDMNHSGATLILRTVSKDRSLKDLPLVLLGKKSSKVKQRDGAVASVDMPYQPQYLVKIMGELIEKARSAKEVEDNYWQYAKGDGKTIAVIDPRHRLHKIHFDALKKINFNLIWIQNEKGIVDQINDARPDIVLLSNDTGHLNPSTLCRMINLNKQIKDIPKILIVPDEELAKSDFLETKGIYYLYRRFDARQLVVGIFKALGVDL